MSDPEDYFLTTNGHCDEAIVCILDAYRRVNSLDELIHFTVDGFRKINLLPKLLEPLGSFDQAEMENAKRRADAAEQQMAKDFPLLHEQAVITLWSSIEAAIRNLFAALIKNETKLRETESFGKVRVNFVTYEALTGIDKNLYLVDALEEALSTKRKAGIGRFELLFREMGLSSPVSSHATSCLLELYHIRNVIVHRQGKVDRRLLTDCPWLDLAEGDKLSVSHVQYHQFRIAALIYLDEILNRIRVMYEFGPLQHSEDCPCDMHTFEFNTELSAKQTSSPWVD